MKPSVSVVIRTYNEEKFIGRLIRNLRLQSEFGREMEIVVVDSGSTDRTAEFLDGFDVKIITIPQSRFNYSSALNLGIQESRGDLIAILSAHAIPTTRQWVSRMVSHFRQKETAGVYCKQISHPESQWHEVVRLKKMFGDDLKIYDSGNSGGEVPFSNAASCIRRGVWERHHFASMPAAEDNEWARWALEAGYKIIYDPAAQVYHSHTESCRQTAERIIQLEKAGDLAHHRRRNLFLTCRQSIGWFVRDFRQVLALKESYYHKLVFVRGCMARSFWFVYDFGRKNSRHSASELSTG